MDITPTACYGSLVLVSCIELSMFGTFNYQTTSRIAITFDFLYTRSVYKKYSDVQFTKMPPRRSN
jgi:hypothetical protein